MKEYTTSERLNQIMRERNLKQVDILEAAKPYTEKYGIKLNKNDLSQYVSGKNEPGQRKLTILGLALNVSETWLMGYDVSRERTRQAETEISEEENLFEKYSELRPIATKKFPLLGKIACGEPIFDEEYDSFIEASSEIKADFALVCKGDSMINARINDGDVVFIRQMDMVENGKIAAVNIDGEVTLKRVYYYPEKNKLVLNPENPAYEPFVYVNEELDTIRILGLAVAFTSLVK